MTELAIGLGIWLVVSVVAAAGWTVAAHRLRTPLTGVLRHRRRVMAGQGLVLAVSVPVAFTVTPAGDWRPAELLAVLTAFALASDAMPVPVGRLRLGGAFVAIVLAMGLLGPAPAMTIGLLCAGVDALRSRPPLPYLLNNLATCAAFPLLGGLALGALADAPPAPFAIAVAAVAVLANLLNFMLVVGHAAALDPTRDTLVPAIRGTWLPLLPWELATAAVAGLAVYGYATAGAAVVASCAVGLVALQVLLVADPGAMRLQIPRRAR